jgi:membrane protease YdiL (CAAX protease family)
MPPQPDDLWLSAVVSSAILASFCTWFVLFRRMASGVPLLPWEPRRPVPWGSAGALLALLMVGLAVYSAIWPTPVVNFSSSRILQGLIPQIVLTLGVAGALFAISNSNKFDMGLPANGWELLRDIKIGVVAWLAALVPIYGLKIVTFFIWNQMWGEPTAHPLVEWLLKNPDPAFLAVAFVSAVLLAPLSEELSFRLLLQGWLEKVAITPPLTPPHQGEGNEEVDSNQKEGNQMVWPFVVSSLLFALAHAGHGPDPIPLFFLALILGYVYRQTHRIVPCIVAHALFNLLSLLMLAIMLNQGAVPPVP